MISCFLFLFSCHSKRKTTTVKNKDEASSSGITIVAEKMEMEQKEVKDSKLYRFIGEWYGTPYSYSSCSRSGVDCSCFANMLYQQVFQLNLPRSSREIFEVCDKIKKKQLSEGDLVFFNTSGKGVSHVGVFLRNGKFVHASTKKGVMISDLNEEYFQKTYCGSCKKKNYR